ncbi:Pyridoxamine 5'-phosphate oxidase [Rhodobacteraceae bacterium THAF1]|uniref:pyridoxamine 5'-phosphate oxidase family protein n=1 Tax=Palleronia sp. THAF1 TaxID=2587842 RepID=UPI000F40A270|nr:pyridoxamine 5'-phosphate oxidase family protein [Palleronia sp. THAF1]QFU07065.1 Pyridoxamine 5'-phosphate oxidase [Palleronia sp. THAF1]VDC16782.1 Pyridoxamine 5'-phosphate oxidase [Rhodobacteraceae bacterium THAF1]
MSDKTMKDVAEMMADIDFCMMETKTDGDRIATRPMSSNGDVDYDGDSYFFSYENSRKIRDIRADPHVSLSFQGTGGVMGLVGKPGNMVAVQGKAELIDDKSTFAEHWVPDLEYWFKDGIETPGMILIKVHADRVTYWSGMDQGEFTL